MTAILAGPKPPSLRIPMRGYELLSALSVYEAEVKLRIPMRGYELYLVIFMSLVSYCYASP